MRRFLSIRHGLSLVGLILALVYLRVALSRVSYPFTLDLVEEGMLMQAWRVAQNQPVFIPPSADFAPQVYMPLYTWISGQLLRLTGFAFWPLRALSLASTLVIALLLFLIGRRESHSSEVAWWGSLLFLSGYRLVGGWYDLARVDTLFVALALSGMASAVFAHRSNRGLLLTGLLMGLALLAKQNGVFLAGIVGIYLWLVARRRWWLYGLSLLITTALPLFYLQISSHGWFSYYVVEIAYASPLDLRRLWHILGGEILAGLGILGLLGGMAALAESRNGWRGSPRSAPWFLFASAAVFVSLAGRTSVGGNLNNLILGYALICLSPALLAKASKKTKRSAPGWVRGMLHLAVFSQLILNQFQPLGGGAMPFVPQAKMIAAGDALVQQLAAADGQVLVMMHPSYAVRAGKEASVHIQSLWHARHRGRDPLPPDFVTRIEQQQYALIISDDSPFFEQDPFLVDLLEKHYSLDRNLTETESPPTLSGLIIRPQQVYVPARP